MFHLSFILTASCLLSTLAALSLGPSDGKFFFFTLESDKDFDSLSYYTKVTIGTNKKAGEPFKYQNNTNQDEVLFYPGQEQYMSFSTTDDLSTVVGTTCTKCQIGMEGLAKYERGQSSTSKYQDASFSFISKFPAEP